MPTCAHCFHSGPVHTSSPQTGLAPRVWCRDCVDCREESESRDLPLDGVRMSHIALLRVLDGAGSGHHVNRADAAPGYERQSALWIAPEDHLDTVVRDLAAWGLVERSTGFARPIHPASPTPSNDGAWSAHATQAGRDLLEALRRQGR